MAFKLAHLTILLVCLAAIITSGTATDDKVYECIPKTLSQYVVDGCSNIDELICVRNKKKFTSKLDNLATKLSSTMSLARKEKARTKTMMWIRRRMKRMNEDHYSCRSMDNCKVGTFQLIEAGINYGLYEPNYCYREFPGDEGYLCERMASTGDFKASITCLEWFGDS